MRVGLSAYLLHQGKDYRSAGVSTYVRHLISSLPAAAPGNDYVAFHGKDAPPLSGMHSVVAPLPTLRPAVRIAWEQLALPLQLRRQNINVVHGTVNVLPIASRVPSVVTVHDLAFLRHRDRFSRYKAAYLRSAVSMSVKLAHHVVAVSESTRTDVLELLGKDSGAVSVVYSGVDRSFHPMDINVRDKFRRDRLGGRRCILYVGTLEPRKNIDVLIRAFARLRSRCDLPHLLVLAGAEGWMYQGLHALAAELNVSGAVVFAGYVPSEELPLWYNCADLFAYPSAYEGFGLPVLEAMACGTPVVTSATSALEELAQNACVTVEPGSEEALEVAIERVLFDDRLADQLRRAGLRRAADFDWLETARKTAQVYALVSGEPIL